jgi:hypothetical protein
MTVTAGPLLSGHTTSSSLSSAVSDTASHNDAHAAAVAVDPCKQCSGRAASNHAAAWREFWKVTLKGAPAVLQLPQDRPRPAQPSFESAVLIQELPAGLHRSLGDVAADLQVTLPAALLGIWQVKKVPCLSVTCMANVQ